MKKNAYVYTPRFCTVWIEKVFASEVDGYMLMFYEEETWQKFVDVFDILGMDFTTGEPDGEFKTWYIDFEFSDGISD